MTKKVEEAYETTDITFAASLLCLEKKLKASQPTGRGGEVSFLFYADPEINILFEDYINGDLKIDPNSLMNHIRNLKATARGKI